MKTNFVLIDLENVQPNNISLLNGGPFKIKVFLGANQVKVPIDMARALQLFGPDADYVQIEGNGSNALDFHIAYYIGRLAAENPGAFFHVISKDTGFDPLIKHLKTQKIFCRRSASIADIPVVKRANSKTLPEKVDALIGNFSKRKATKPRTLKTLRSSVKALFMNRLSDEELAAVIEELGKRGVVKVVDGKVNYDLPP